MVFFARFGSYSRMQNCRSFTIAPSAKRLTAKGHSQFPAIRYMQKGVGPTFPAGSFSRICCPDFCIEIQQLNYFNRGHFNNFFGTKLSRVFPDFSSELVDV
jgi:hypothetical protein